MQLFPVKSSNIRAIGYDPTTREMHVEFGSGGTYQYGGITPQQHQALTAAASIGRHFAREIQKRHIGRKVN